LPFYCIIVRQQKESSMSYEKSVPFSGNVGKAFEAARNTLLPHGFEIVENDDDYMELTGPNTIWVKQNSPFIGISRISISAEDNELTIHAEFRGGMMVFKVVIILIVFIVASIFIYLAITSKKVDKAFPSIFLTFILAFIISAKPETYKLLDALLNNMAILGKEK
jgi:hypothetical protein